MPVNLPAYFGSVVVFAGGLILVALGQVAFGETVCALSGGSIIGISIPTTSA